jgi:hypothetical protein
MVTISSHKPTNSSKSYGYSKSLPIMKSVQISKYISEPSSIAYIARSLTHGAEPFLRSRELCRYSRTSQLYATQRFFQSDGDVSSGVKLSYNYVYGHAKESIR